MKKKIVKPLLKKHITTVFEIILNKGLNDYVNIIIDQDWCKKFNLKTPRFKRIKENLTNCFKELVEELNGLKVFDAETKIKSLNVRISDYNSSFTCYRYSMIIDNAYYSIELEGELLENSKLQECKEIGSLACFVKKNKNFRKKIKAKKGEILTEALARYRTICETVQLKPISTRDAIETTEERLKISLPSALKEMYIEVGNGFGASMNGELEFFKHQDIIGIIDFYQEQANEGTSYNVFTETHLGERQLSVEEQKLVKHLNETVFIFGVNWLDDQSLVLILFNKNGQFAELLYDTHEEYRYFDDYLKPFLEETKWQSDLNVFFSELITAYLKKLDS